MYFIQWLACRDSAHNPSPTRSLLQIPTLFPYTTLFRSYRVYVIQNREGKFYIGLTDDVGRRINQHNMGGSRWTRGKGPWTLRSEEDTSELQSPGQLECWLQSEKGVDVFYPMVGLSRFSS